MLCLEAWVGNEPGRENIVNGDRAQPSKGTKMGKKIFMENK